MFRKDSMVWFSHDVAKYLESVIKCLSACYVKVSPLNETSTPALYNLSYMMYAVSMWLLRKTCTCKCGDITNAEKVFQSVVKA